MELLNDGVIGKLFNSPLEAGLRAVVILERLWPDAVDINDLILFDHIVVHTSDFGGPNSIHPSLPNEIGELLVRRQLIEESLDLMRRCHLINIHYSEDGTTYAASDEASDFVGFMETSYAEKLKKSAAWMVDKIKSTPDQIVTFRNDVSAILGKWAEEFSLERSLS